jgi:hypothetical protein
MKTIAKNIGFFLLGLTFPIWIVFGLIYVFFTGVWSMGKLLHDLGRDMWRAARRFYNCKGWRK